MDNRTGNCKDHKRNILHYSYLNHYFYSEVLCELFYIQINVQHEPTERANKNIRANLRLLNNETFLKENGVLVFEVIELYDEIEIEDGVESCWKV